MSQLASLSELTIILKGDLDLAIISCPYCGKRVSSKAEQCSHCGGGIAGQSEESRENQRAIVNINREKRLMTQSFLALLLFLGGVLAMYTVDMAQYPWARPVCTGAIALGFIWYIVVRIYKLWTKKKKR